MSTYDTDFYSWTQQQAALLRQGCLAELDIENLIEEIEGMGRSESRELESRLAVLLMHLLKWKYQPEQQSRNWEGTIREQRNKVKRLLRQNPGLKPVVNESFLDAYEDSRPAAMRETGLHLDTFPKTCPWTFDQVINDDFWPG